MATTSQRQLIIEALQDKLQAITGSDYHYPLTSAAQVTVDPGMQILGPVLSDLPIYVIETTPDGTKQYLAASQLLEVMRVNIHARHDADPVNPSSKLSVFENLKSDMERALAVDITLGGLAVDVRLFTAAEFVGMGQPIVIVTQPVEIRLYRAYGSP